jgi:hypothetical protein
MKSLRKLTPLFRLLFALLVFSIALVLLYRGASGPTNAQQSQSSPQERQIENTIPKHVPIDVKITKEKEKAWKDLKNENWSKDFELEITNTGEKPIYTFYLLLLFDVPNEFEDELVAPVYYGRAEIGNPRAKAGPEDVPIKSGESQVFKIHPNQITAFEKGRREKHWRLPTKVTIKLEILTFGDGTGFQTNQGVPFPRVISKAKHGGEGEHLIG